MADTDFHSEDGSMNVPVEAIRRHLDEARDQIMERVGQRPPPEGEEAEEAS